MPIIHHKERNSDIINKYLTGQFRQTDIAMEYGLSRERVRHIIAKYLTLREIKLVKEKYRYNKWLSQKPV